MPSLPASLMGALVLLLALYSPLPSMGAGACSSSRIHSHDLGVSIGKIHRFFRKSGEAPSINFDRLEYLLADFEQIAAEWVRCQPPGSGHYNTLLSRLHSFRQRIREERSTSLFLGGPRLSRRTVQGIEEILSKFPGGNTGPEEGGSFGSPLTPPARSPAPMHLSFVKWIVLGGVVLGGLLFLFLTARLIARKPLRVLSTGGSVPPAFGEGDLKSFRRDGATWLGSHLSRRQVLDAMKKRIGRGMNFVRIRAQLLKQDTENRWKVIDEISDDEGGHLRTFEETPEIFEPRESVEEVDLGEGEQRTRLVLPLSGDNGETVLMVVDAIASREITPSRPDPSGLRTPSQMKELLFDLAHEMGEDSQEHLGILSFFFDDPAVDRIHEQSGEEAQYARNFIVRETIKRTRPGIFVYGEPPGLFHLVLKGRAEGETGAWIRNLSEGLVPDPGEPTLGNDRPWFRKIHVAYTGWKEPDPGKIEPFLERVHKNIAKLKSNPSIRTVIDL